MGFANGLRKKIIGVGAIATGYRPCLKCMKELFKKWDAGGKLGTKEYPWLCNLGK